MRCWALKGKKSQERQEAKIQQAGGLHPLRGQNDSRKKTSQGRASGLRSVAVPQTNSSRACAKTVLDTEVVSAWHLDLGNGMEALGFYDLPISIGIQCGVGVGPRQG